jgi:ankyrin repeat protein
LEALKHQDIEAVATLLDTAPNQGALLREHDARGNTPLMVVAYRDLVGNIGDRDLITNYGVIDDLDNRDFLTALLGVASDQEKVARNDAGNNLLHIARSGKAMNHLLDDRTVQKLYATKNNLGQTPLHLSDTDESARRLLESYAQEDRLDAVNAVDNAGNTPIFYSRDPLQADYLLSQGARIATINKEHKTPLVFILTVASFEVTPIPGVDIRHSKIKRRMLLPDPDIRSIMAAYMVNKVDRTTMVRTAEDTDVPFLDVVDHHGNVALHYLIIADLDMPTKRTLVSNMIAAGAQKNIQNDAGKTPRDLAQELNNDGSYAALIRMLN